MTGEQAFFFQVLRDYLNRQTTELPNEVDVGKICVWAESHKLGGIFFAQCGSLLAQSPAVFARLQKAFGAAVYHSAARDAAYSCLQAAFQQAEIPFVPIKGAVIASIYPDPQLRTMGDMDLLVRSDDRERIRDVLTPLGFTNTKWSEVEWDYRHDKVNFELQAELIHPGELQNRDLESWLNDVWPQVESDASGGYRLNVNFHFLYLIAHIAKHLRWVGVGFRQFYDLSVMMQCSGKTYDWRWIREQAERLNLFQFVMICLALNERWFGVPSPYPTDVLTDELFERVTSKIFADGVFGFDNKENRILALTRLQDCDDQIRFSTRIKATFHYLFPPYRELATSAKYSYLRGRRWLLPVAWISRILRSKRKTSNLQQINVLMTASEADAEKQLNELKELGL